MRWKIAYSATKAPKHKGSQSAFKRLGASFVPRMFAEQLKVLKRGRKLNRVNMAYLVAKTAYSNRLVLTWCLRALVAKKASSSLGVFVAKRRALYHV